MIYKQKLARIGNSIGIVLPKKLLDSLTLSVGNELFVEQVQNKIILKKENTPSVSPEFLRVAESIGEKYKNAFKELA